MLLLFLCRISNKLSGKFSFYENYNSQEPCCGNKMCITLDDDDKNFDCVRFCLSSKQMGSNMMRNRQPDKQDENLTWYETFFDTDGNIFITKHIEDDLTETTDISFGYSDGESYDLNTRWIFYPKNKYGDKKFLMYFGNDCDISIDNKIFGEVLDKNTDISLKKDDKSDVFSVVNENWCVYLYKQYDENGCCDFFMSIGLNEYLSQKFTHGIFCDENLFTLRLCITNEKLNFERNQQFDATAAFAQCKKKFLFEIIRDKNNYVIMKYINADAKIYKIVDSDICLERKYRFICKTNSENNVVKSYFYNYLVYEDSKQIWNKVSEKTVTLNNSLTSEINTNSFESNNKNENKKAIESVCKIEQNPGFFKQHKGKTIFFSLVAIIIGLYFSWLYALIPIAALIIFVILDHKFNFLPRPKKILTCLMPCLSCLKETKEIESLEMSTDLKYEIKI